MGELDEFAEALLDQIAVEVSEEREIERLAGEIAADPSFGVSFEPLGGMAERVLPEMVGRAEEFTGMRAAEGIRVSLTELDEFKMLKAKKVYTRSAGAYVDEVFAAVAASDVKAIAGAAGRDTPRFLVYSTYAKSYLSKISTTYGDYMDSVIHLNSFVLSRYPQIILYKQGEPYGSRRAAVGAGYAGAVKMTVLEEAVHSMQSPLEEANRAAVVEVNALNEELARIIMSLEDEAVSFLSEYLKLQQVPESFAVARRANLFFMLNPDNFVAQVLGPDVLMYTNVEVDPKIAEAVPELPRIYESWLGPIQAHHAAFTAMEGMAEFAVREILGDDPDFATYLGTFAGTDMSSYRVRKSIGRDFVEAAHKSMGRDAFAEIMRRRPSTRDLKDPQAWLAAGGA